MDNIDEDNERHKREEQERRAKRKAARESKSESQAEKERKRKEHAQRILQAQKKAKPAPPPTKDTGGSSVFQALFQQRAEGFLIDLKFRNAPPRPPVGPCFVGLGLEGELTDKWTKYKPRNAVERQYVWKIHAEKDLGVPLAVSAMDWEGSYTDPDKAKDDANGLISKDSSGHKSHHVPTLHPDDDALINWKGSLGDTAAEMLQQKRDRARAAARLALAQGYGAPLPLNKALTPIATATSATAFKLKKKHHLQSRILDEKTPNFMKKTTYLTNDTVSVHRFTSLAHTQEKRARDVDRALAETKSKYTETDVIENGFGMANSYPVVGANGALDHNDGGEQKKKRTHPTKKDVFPVWDLPLLPDVATWGHTYTHVVLDNPPKSINTKFKSSSKSKDSNNGNSLVTAQQLRKAIVADVTKQTNNARMACTVWVPNPDVVSDTETISESKDHEHAPAKKIKGESYQAVQRYDLDVVPLRDASGPPVHFILVVDPNKPYVGYHPVGSRVQLSTGRPVVLSGRQSSSENKSEIDTDKSIITRREMEREEREDIEKKAAEVDVDLAEKYGLVEGDVEGAGRSKGEKTQRSSAYENRGQKDDEEDEESEEDAF